MKILVACEFSGVVREAFAKRGHDAWSCDLLPTEIPGQHIQGDVLKHLNDGWDLMIAHPPCTHLAVSGARYFKEKIVDGRQKQAIDFFMQIVKAPINKIAVENPISIMSMRYRKPDQIIQPCFFGNPVFKTTCLWLKNLPRLVFYKYDQEFGKNMKVEPEFTVYKNSGKRVSKHHYDTFYLPKAIRGHERSRTFQGIADAMAEQWG